METVTFNMFCENIPDLLLNLQNDNIKIIPLKRNSKAPRDNGWNKKQYSLKQLQNHKGNFGIIPGYNHTDCSLAIVDIDGYTIDSEDEAYKQYIKKETQEYIYEALKDLPNCMIVQTQSGGYHIYLWNQTIINNFHEVSKHLRFPTDFHITELQGKSLKHSIEIFTKEGSKQCLLPGCIVYNEATNKENGYHIISEINKFSDIDVVSNIHETIKNHLINKGFTYAETVEKTSENNTSYENEPYLKELNNKEIKEAANILCPLIRAIDGSKHYGALYLGGYFSTHITKDSANKICNNIIRLIGDLFEDKNGFKKTILKNYDKTGEKAGLPHFISLVHDHIPGFNEKKFRFEMKRLMDKEFNHIILLDKKNNNCKKYLKIDYTNKEIGVYTWNINDNVTSYSDIHNIMNLEPIEFYELYNILDKQEASKLCFKYYRKGMPYPQIIKGDDIVSIENELKKRPGIVLRPKEFQGILNIIFKEYVELEQINIVVDIPIEGVFINPLNNELVRSNKEGNVPIIKPSKQSCESALNILWKLYENYKGDKTKLSHILRFGIRCPFSYIFKTDYEWTKLLFLYGVSQTAKTTLAEIALSMYTTIDDDISLGGSSADSLYRLGNALSRQGIGVIINEPGNSIEKSDNLDLIKRAVESKYCREKMDNGTHKKIPAYANMIFTSNSFIPTHDAFIRRSEFIEFTKSERMNEKDLADFSKKFHHINWRDTDFLELRSLGDFFIYHVSKHLELFYLKPSEFVNKLLDALLDYVGYDKKLWDWIYHDTILMDMSSSDEVIIESFRSMVLEDYNKNVHLNSLPEPGESVDGTVKPPGFSVGGRENVFFKQNLLKLIRNRKIPYLSVKGDDSVVVRPDVKDSLKRFCGSDVTCKALADLFGKEYKNNRVDGKIMKSFLFEYDEFEYILR